MHHFPSDDLSFEKFITASPLNYRSQLYECTVHANRKTIHDALRYGILPRPLDQGVTVHKIYEQSSKIEFGCHVNGHCFRFFHLILLMPKRAPLPIRYHSILRGLKCSKMTQFERNHPVCRTGQLLLFGVIIQFRLNWPYETLVSTHYTMCLLCIVNVECKSLWYKTYCQMTM